MKTWLTMLAAWCAGPLGMAGEVVLYDCDWTDAPDQIGNGVALAGMAFPGRTGCSDIVFGQVVIDEAPAPWTGTAAMMRPSQGQTNLRYSQMQFLLFGGGVYVFRKHRIETVFRFPDSATSSATDSLTIHTDGGVTNSISFSASGTSGISVNVKDEDSHWGPGAVWQYHPLAAFDPAQPVHLVWETDVNGGSTSVTINGQTTVIDGLAPLAYGLRNWQLFPGPLTVRPNFSASNTATHLPLRSLRITGDDYDGPLYVDPDAESEELDVVTVPFEVPVSGTWQPRFSLDGVQWISYGLPVVAGFPFGSISFGKQVSPTMFFRLDRVGD